MSEERLKQTLKKSKPEPFPEEKTVILAKIEAEQKAAKDEAQRIELYGKNVEKMTYRQLRGELRRTVKREYAGRPPAPQPGLTIAYGSVLLAVLENTKTKENPFGKLRSYV